MQREHGEIIICDADDSKVDVLENMQLSRITRQVKKKVAP